MFLLYRCYFFGGGGFRKKLNDFFSLDLQSYKWNHYNLQNKPQARNYHSVNLINNYMVIFGGELISDLNDFSVLGIIENSIKLRLKLNDLENCRSFRRYTVSQEISYLQFHS
jgi:hypothetical protein